MWRMNKYTIKLFYFILFLPSLGPHLPHMEAPRLGVKLQAAGLHYSNARYEPHL